jgi:hypothetical protein
LFYVDPFFDFSKSASFSSTSRFEFNSSIASQPFNQSFANIVGQRRFGSKLPRWTTSEYAFESFGFPDALPNATWEAAVNGFTSWLDCSAIRYTPVPGCKSSMAHNDLSKGEIDDYCAPNPWSVDETSTPLHLQAFLEPNKGDMLNAGCEMNGLTPIFLSKDPNFSDYSQIPHFSAWMNGSTCSNDGSWRIAFTILEVKDPSFNHSKLSDQVAASGILWSPRYQMEQLKVVINASTGDVISFQHIGDRPAPVNIGLADYNISSFIAPPVASDTFLGDSSAISLLQMQWAQEESVSYTPFDIYNMDPRHMEISWDSGVEFVVGIDSWFNMLTLGNITLLSDYVANSSQFIHDSSQLFRSVLVQMASASARNGGTELRADSSPDSIPGTISTYRRRIAIGESSCPSLEVIFAVLAVIVCLCGTVLRPRTLLNEDPGTLKAMSILAANSTELDGTLKSSALSDKKDLAAMVEGAKFGLMSNLKGYPTISVLTASAEKTV